ncbi:hypothetical protein [Corynebacterium cystitidis]|uniref:hypothetical protein n=1 Tax=Corynebacterium cystitidis TaxID=35757 RepID=UPI00211EDEF9|nr:hypothetical protein [Corynebacterium cystitidis]
MPRITISFGAILIILGIIAYFATGMASWTALIPSILGAVIAIFGAIGIKQPKIGIHIALVVAILGILGTFRSVLQLGEVFAGTAQRPAAVIVSTITFVLLVVYLVLGIRSFMAARRWKEETAIAESH